MECPAYPRPVRILAVVLLVDLLLAGAWSWPALSSVAWSLGSLLLMGLALLACACLGGWMVVSRTRLQGDELTQSWLWSHKRVRAQDVAHWKLVHWPWLRHLVAPRLLVRRRQGGMTWFHAADVRLLHTFTERARRLATAPLATAPHHIA